MSVQAQARQPQRRAAWLPDVRLPRVREAQVPQGKERAMSVRNQWRVILRRFAAGDSVALLAIHCRVTPLEIEEVIRRALRRQRGRP